MPPFGKQLPARSLTTQTYESPLDYREASRNW